MFFSFRASVTRHTVAILLTVAPVQRKHSSCFNHCSVLLACILFIFNMNELILIALNKKDIDNGMVRGDAGTIRKQGSD